MLLTKKPIVLVPGFGGSKLVKNKCASLHKAKNEFINLNVFKKEWKEDFKLKYDPEVGFSIDDNIDAYDFGGINGIRNLCEDCDKIDGLLEYFGHDYRINDIYNYRYFDTLIKRLEHDGYVPTIDLFGAPYDFRKIMFDTYLEDYSKKFKALVEDAVGISRNKTIIVAHSIGSLIVYILLCEFLDGDWKSKYIDSFVSVGAPFGGCSTALKTILSGLPKLHFLKDRYADVMESSSGLALALPNMYGYDTWQPLVYNVADGNTNVYTLENYDALLPHSMKYIHDNHVKQFLPTFRKNTGVKSVFITTNSKETEMAYTYDRINKVDYTEPIEVHYCLGDSLIPSTSLSWHKRNMFWWYSFHEISSTEHTKVLHTRKLFDIIKSLSVA